MTIEARRLEWGCTMSNSKMKMFAAAVGIAVTVVGVMIASAPRSEAAIDFFLFRTVCHAQRDGSFIELEVFGAGAHAGHKEDIILPAGSTCPEKVASRIR
jgi:hypothetical protein